MAYVKPVLIETYAEIHLDSGTLTEARIFDVVPRLKSMGFAEIELVNAGVTLDIKQGVPAPRERQRVRCWRSDKTQLVQVGEDIVVVNLTGQYPGWDAFVSLFSEALKALTDSISNLAIRSVNLGAIDRFTVAREGFVLSDYLAAGGAVIPQWYRGCTESIDIDLGRGLLEKDGHNRQVHVDVRAAADPVTVVMRTQFHDRVNDEADLLRLLSKLHDEANRTFESMITMRLRTEVMGGKRA